MAADLQSGFINNINILQIRTSGSSMQRVTDRSIDIDGDGIEEALVVTPGTVITNSSNGSKMNPGTSTDGGVTGKGKAGIAHSVIERVVEPDGGINISGSEFTEGAD